MSQWVDIEKQSEKHNPLLYTIVRAVKNVGLDSYQICCCFGDVGRGTALELSNPQAAPGIIPKADIAIDCTVPH
jgi:hypothetical protein